MTTAIKAIAFVGLILLIVDHSHAASSNPPFAASCQDVLTHGYRDGTDLNGKPVAESWSNDEHFNSTWKFVHKGGQQITIDDKQAIIALEHPGVLIVIDGSTNGHASGVWSYAIHLGMKKVVASQVNAFGSLDDTTRLGVKARAVNLKCIFAFNTAQPPSFASSMEDIVRQAQAKLKVFGFYQGPVDGTLNPETRTALRQFQLAESLFVEGLSTDGGLDGATRKALGIE